LKIEERANSCTARREEGLGMKASAFPHALIHRSAWKRGLLGSPYAAA
jgi:hypothetical protein